MKQIPTLKFHAQSCFTCRYYRIHQHPSCASAECLLLGRSLSSGTDSYADRARFCEGWKRRPKNWEVYTDKNPHWEDKHIPRETLLKLRVRLSLDKENEQMIKKQSKEFLAGYDCGKNGPDTTNCAF